MTEKNFAVSVIIPMYNAEKFIGECLTSLANQTLQDFEVIVVDDCSTDNSREVVKSFFETFDGKLKLKKLPKNSGCPGTPRNLGLEAARGKYIYFLDSDDFLTETAFEELYNVAENFNADVVHCEKFFLFFGDGRPVKAESFQTDRFVTEPMLETFDIGQRVTDFTSKRYYWAVWGKLFRRKFLRDNKIKFPSIKTFEDFVVTFMILIAAKNYVRVPFVSYYYRIREDSLSHEMTDGSRFMDDVLGVIKSTNDFMNGIKFFADNSNFKYLLSDFFMQERLEVFAKNFLASDKYSVGEIYKFLYYTFSRRPQDLVALTSYLFLTANIFKLHNKQQTTEIESLKKQLGG